MFENNEIQPAPANGPLRLRPIPPEVLKKQPEFIRQRLVSGARNLHQGFKPSPTTSLQMDRLLPKPPPSRRDDGFAAMMLESNFVLAGISAASDAMASRGEADPNFNASRYTEEFGLSSYIKSEAHLDYINGAKNREDYRFRVGKVSDEIGRAKSIAELSFGESIGYAILGGVTDPFSYLPIVGQTGKLKNVGKLYRNATRALQSGVPAKQVRREILEGSLKKSVWQSAAEGAVYESAFQGLLLADRVDDSQIAGMALPTIAMTSAFSGVLGGALGYTSKRFSAGKVVGRAEGRIRPDTQTVQAMSLDLGSRSTLGSTLGKGSGARARVKARQKIVEYREAQKGAVMDFLLDLGVASNPVEASAFAAKILTANPRWIAPLDINGNPRVKTSFAGEILGEAELLDLFDGDLVSGLGEVLGDDLTPKKIANAKRRLTIRINRMKQAELEGRRLPEGAEHSLVQIEDLLDGRGQPPKIDHREAFRLVKRDLGENVDVASKASELEQRVQDGKLSWESAYEMLVATSRSAIEDSKSAQDLINLRKQLDELSDAVKKGSDEPAVDATKDAVARTLNRPRPATVPETPASVAGDPGVASVGKKVSEMGGREMFDRLRQLAADAKNGTADWLNFVRYGLGRGMFGMVADRGEMTFAFRSSGSDSPLTLKLNIKKASLPGGDRGGYNPKTGEIFVDYDYIVKNWNDIRDEELFFADGIELAGNDWQRILQNVTEQQASNKVTIGDVARSPQEYADWVVMHEVAHHRLVKEQDEMIEAIKSFAKKKGMSSEEADLVSQMVVEGQSNQMAKHWRNEASVQGPDNRPDVTYGLADGPMPKNNSIPQHSPSSNPIHALVGNYFAQGFSRGASKYAAKLARIVSPAMRAATSPSETLRTMAREMFETPFHLVGSGNPNGSASTRVKMYYEGPTKVIRKRSIAAWKEASRKAETKISWEEFDERVFLAIAKKDGVFRKDAYSTAVRDAAEAYVKINESLRRRGIDIAWSKSEPVFPEGERYYRRVYDNVQVGTPEFIDLLVKHGASIEGAKKIQSAIRGNIGVFSDEISEKAEIAVKGALRSRNEFLREIPVEELMPFLNRSGFETQLNAARSIGGEIEMRRSMIKVHRDIVRRSPGKALKEVKTVNGVTREYTRSVVYQVQKSDAAGKKSDGTTGEPDYVMVFDMEPIFHAIRTEMGSARKTDKGKRFFNSDYFSLAFDVEKKKYSEVYDKFFGKDGDRWVMDLTNKQFKKEDEFAMDFAADMVRILQKTKDIPENADSWMQARLPNLIKNFSHTIMGGSLGVANLADFHRSVTEYGFRHVFRNEWSLWIKDAEGWAQRNKLTEEMALALEDQVADVERMLRNVQEHELGETLPERLAEQGASLMSKINFMDKVTNTHQRMFSSGTQGFIIENLEGFVDGSLGKRGKMKMSRLGLDARSAKVLKHYFDNGALKETELGTKYVDFNAFDNAPVFSDGIDVGPAEARGYLAAAVNRGVSLIQTVPGRNELHDFQVQGWGSVLTMYRNWVTAANNRIMASAISDPKDAALMSGIAASVGLGAMITLIRSAINNEDDPMRDPAQFMRRAIDSGGYFGLIGEANNLVSRITNGSLDLNPIGTGSSRFYDNTTALAAVMGPVWHYPNFVLKTLKPGEMNRHDIERIRGMIPFMNLFYVDGLWNRMMDDSPKKPVDPYPNPDWKSLNPFTKDEGVKDEFDRRGININTGQPYGN